MSKWVNTEKFEEFKNERASDSSGSNDDVSFARKYPNPKMGSQNKPKEYHTRLIPDLEGSFYKKFHYHMFQTGESWNFIMCPKTKDFDTYCPWCALTQLLYQGSDADKKRAYNYKRKDKFVGNVFVVKDPRDADQGDEAKMLGGKTFLYEFPATIEQLIKKEITDVENGWGYKIFDPEDGYNLIISIGAKKADKNGKVWPDYSLTTFSKRPSAIGDDVDAIMNTTQLISEYIDNSLKSNSEHAELLKSEMVYDDVAETFERHMSIDEKGGIEEDKPSKKDIPEDKVPVDKVPEDDIPASDDDIDALLDGL